MKKIIALTTITGIYLAFGCKKVSAWFGTTHEDFARKALDLLEKEGKGRPTNFYKQYHKEIIAGCTEPDIENDVDSGTGLHYYCCVNQKGKEQKSTGDYYKNRLGKLSKSARTLLEENYTAAVCLYKSGKTAEGMKSLGRALHFLSDIGCTFHVSGQRSSDKATNPHYAYEKHANTICKQYIPETYDKRLQKVYDNGSFGEATNKLAKIAGKFADSVSRLDPRAFDEASAGTIPATQQNCTALLLKFVDDCNADKGNFITDKKMCTFKNERTNGVLTVTEKGLVLDNPDKHLEQRLLVCLDNSGSFGLKIQSGGYVNESCKDYDYLKVGGTPAQFRASALGKRRFRISTGGTQFTKVLGTSQNGALTLTDFNPDDSGQVWIIN